MEIEKIYRPYTPSRQKPGFLERTFIGHGDLLSDLLASIKDQSQKPTHQHWLLVGPRGIGKSHIVALLMHRVRRSALKARWLPIWFPEEATGIITLRDFLEKVMRLASEELGSEGSPDEARRFEELLEALHGETNDRKAMNRIKAFLIDWKTESQRKIIVLLENADRVLGNRIANKLPDEKWLRDLMMNEDLVLFIATSPTFFKQVVNKDHPLYELFRIEVIGDLDFEESLKLLIKYAKEYERSDLVKHFETKRNRIEAMHTLTGGNPRLLIMLYILIQDSIANISDVEVGFFNLLEELTPYFQARTAQLKPQGEKVLIAFAEGPVLLTPAEVGRKIRMATNLVTANLKRLEVAGFINRIERPIKGRKGTLYRLSETIYRYWYQMHSERNKEMAEIFVRFIVLFYTYGEIEQMYTARIGEQGEDERAYRGSTDAPRDLQYLEAARGIAKDAETVRLFIQVEKAIEENRPYDEIKKIFYELMEISQDDYVILNFYSLFLINSGDIETAVAYFEKAAGLTEKQKFRKYRGMAYNNWGTALLDLAELRQDEGLFRESFEKYRTAWGLIKRLNKFDHPLMVNTGLMVALMGFRAGSEDEANHAFVELVGALPKVTDLKATIPYFFSFFISLAKLPEITSAKNYLDQLLRSKFKEALAPLTPLRFLLEYLDKKDDTIIRRQPPEIQKVLNEMIREIEGE